MNAEGEWKKIRHMVNLAKFQDDIMTIASVCEGLTMCWVLCSFFYIYHFVQCCSQPHEVSLLSSSTNGETEAQGGYVICPMSNNKWQN